MFSFSGGYEVFSVLSQESLTEMSYTFEAVVPLTSEEDCVIGCFNNVKCDTYIWDESLTKCEHKEHNAAPSKIRNRNLFTRGVKFN